MINKKSEKYERIREDGRMPIGGKHVRNSTYFPVKHDKFINRLVKKGYYGSKSEFVREAAVDLVERWVAYLSGKSEKHPKE